MQEHTEITRILRLLLTTVQENTGAEEMPITKVQVIDFFTYQARSDCYFLLSKKRTRKIFLYE